MLLNFFVSSRRRHTRFDCDWSSDVCSSDLTIVSARASKFLTIRSRVNAVSPWRANSNKSMPDKTWSASAACEYRSEERRVGEEGRSRWAPYYLKKKKKNLKLYSNMYLTILK